MSDDLLHWVHGCIKCNSPLSHQTPVHQLKVVTWHKAVFTSHISSHLISSELVSGLSRVQFSSGKMESVSAIWMLHSTQWAGSCSADIMTDRCSSTA